MSAVRLPPSNSAPEPKLGPRDCVFLASFLAVLVAVYSLPALATFVRMGPGPVPPSVTTDLFLYLHASDAPHPRPGFVENPWYKTEVPANGLAFSKFNLALKSLGELKRLLGPGWTLPLLVWNVAWTLAIGVTAIWLFRTKMGLHQVPWLLACLSAFFFFKIGTLSQIVGAISHGDIHLAGLGGRWVDLQLQAGALPFERTVFPQVAVPLLLGYVGFLMAVLQRPSVARWTALAVLQALALAAFPYACLWMALATALVLLASLRVRPLGPFLGRFLLFGAVCAVGDAVFLFALPPSLHAAVTQTSVVDWAVLRVMVSSKTSLLVAALTLLCAVTPVRDDSQRIRRRVGVAFGAAFVLAHLGDAFFGPALQVSHHIEYFTQIAAAILIVFPVTVVLERGQGGTRWVRAAALVLVAACSLNGIAVAYGFFEDQWPYFERETALSRVLPGLALQRNDLILAAGSDDHAVPLLSDAAVLYCKNAELLMDDRAKSEDQRFRQAMYMYFLGHDTQWLLRVLGGRSDSNEFRSLFQVQQQELLTGPHLAEQVAVVKRDLVPRVSKLEEGDPRVEEFLRRYNRIVVVDTVVDPQFDRDALARYFEIERVQREGDFDLVWVKAR